jgi:hypothetical protein
MKIIISDADVNNVENFCIGILIICLIYMFKLIIY